MELPKKTDKNYIFKLADDWVRYHNKDIHDAKWQKRCSDCLAPCCYFSMQGFVYDYTKEKEFKEFDEMKDFFTYDFVIMDIKSYSWEENREMGFNIIFNPEELQSGRGLQVCPLNILGKCLIYEDRPEICKNWRCQMKLQGKIE